MEKIEIIKLVFATGSIVSAFLAYHFGIKSLRAEKIYIIRIGWILNMDNRIDKYSFKEMMEMTKPKTIEWRLPKDSDFK